jgi:ParB/RepB/Spo0J family partition protein
MQTQDSSTRSVALKQIERNEENPRLIFRQDRLDTLRDSIKQVGILVPLIVAKRGDKYILVDGERRWLCAKQLGISEVPVNIIEAPDETTYILRMFNIHKVREDWELIPTAWKLEKIMDLFDTKNITKLASLTSLSGSTIERCRRLLWYPKWVQELIFEEEKKPESDRLLKEDFFTELYPLLRRLKNRNSQVFERYSQDEVLGALIQKRRSGIIKNVVKVRDLLGLLPGREKNVPEKTDSAFVSFIQNKNMSIEDLSSLTNVQDYGEVKKAKSMAKGLRHMLDSMEQIKDKELIS